MGKKEDVCPCSCLFWWVYKITVFHCHRLLQVCSCSFCRCLIQVSNLPSESDHCGISQRSGMPPVLGMLFHKFQHAVPPTCPQWLVVTAPWGSNLSGEEASPSLHLFDTSPGFSNSWLLKARIWPSLDLVLVNKYKLFPEKPLSTMSTNVSSFLHIFEPFRVRWPLKIWCWLYYETKTSSSSQRTRTWGYFGLFSTADGNPSGKKNRLLFTQSRIFCEITFSIGLFSF